MPEWFNGAVLKIVEGFVLRGFKSYRLRQIWGVVKWLRQRTLTPSFRGSNPLTPAKRISFNGKTLAFQANNAGSIPAIRSKKLLIIVVFYFLIITFYI